MGLLRMSATYRDIPSVDAFRRAAAGSVDDLWEGGEVEEVRASLQERRPEDGHHRLSGCARA